MGKLGAALAWAARGFRIFPLEVNGKLPASDLGWTLAATTDPRVIEMWWRDPVTGVERDNNIGFLTTDWIVPDVDVKDGKPGLATMARLGLDFDTLTMRTPTGGYHLVYRGLPDRQVGGSPLGLGVDLKAVNGYVLAPGSTIDGVPYVVDIDQPIAEFPEHLRHVLKPPRRAADAVPVNVELDTVESLELAAHWLLHDAPVAVQGMNGDDTTYRVCCRLRDFGVSETAALDLFLDEYNPRCEPPWDAGEARAKVENAYRYASGAPGSASPAAIFEDVVKIPTPAGCDTITATPDVSGIFRFGNLMEEDDIRPRPWVLQGFLMERVLTMLVAPGGAGKSLISLMLAAHLAVGQDFMGYEIRKPGKSIIYNAEDDLEEVSRRLLAICDAYGFDRDVVRRQVCLIGSEDFPLSVTVGSPPKANDQHIQMVIDAASEPDVVFFSIDPLIEVHTGRENDVTDMRYVMSLLRHIVRTAGVAGMIVQHTSKQPGGQPSAPGDQDAARGSTGIANATRYILNMRSATETECVQELGVPLVDRGRYVRLDGAKAQARPASERARTAWMCWESRTLTNGDSVGVLLPHDAAKSQDSEATRVAGLLRDHMRREGQASMLIEEAVGALLEARDPLTPPEDRTVVKNRLTRLLTTPVLAGDVRVALVTETEGGRKATRVVLR